MYQDKLVSLTDETIFVFCVTKVPFISQAGLISFKFKLDILKYY